MKKVWEVIKKVLIWIGSVFVAIFTVLFVRDCRVEHDNDRLWKSENDRDILKEEDVEEVNAMAAKKREEAIARIERADVRELAEGYGSVCDAIADGKDRFRKRCERADD